MEKFATAIEVEEPVSGAVEDRSEVCVCCCCFAKSFFSSKSPGMWIPGQLLSKTSASRRQRKKSWSSFPLALEPVHLSWSGYHMAVLWITGPEIVINRHAFAWLCFHVFQLTMLSLRQSWNMSRLRLGRAIAGICCIYLVASKDEERKTNRKWICPLIKFCFSTGIFLLGKPCFTPDDLGKTLFCSPSYEKPDHRK